MSAIKHHLYNLQRNSEPMRYIDPERRIDLMTAYCNDMIEQMSFSDLQEFAFQMMYDNVHELTDDECMAEIVDLQFCGDKKEAAEFARQYITEDEAMNYFKSNISEATYADWKDFWESEEK